MKTKDGKITGKTAFYCEALKVTRQGFYKYLKNRNKPWKYEALAAKMRKIIIRDECNDKYGRERMRFALMLKQEEARSKGEDFPDIPSESTVYRVMSRAGLTKKPNKTPNSITKADKAAQKSENLLNQDFTAGKPYEKCVSDITEVACMDGKLYVSLLADCFDNEVLGLSMADNMRAELVRDTLIMAVRQHQELRINRAIVHSDRGSQYTSDLYRRYLNKYGITQSMNSAAGRCHDNAKAESIIGRFKEELLCGRYDTRKMPMESVKTLIWRYFMGYWNNRRICSANGGLPPAIKKRRYYEQILTSIPRAL